VSPNGNFQGAPLGYVLDFLAIAAAGHRRLAFGALGCDGGSRRGTSRVRAGAWAGPLRFSWAFRRCRTR